MNILFIKWIANLFYMKKNLAEDFLENETKTKAEEKHANLHEFLGVPEKIFAKGPKIDINHVLILKVSQYNREAYVH